MKLRAGLIGMGAMGKNHARVLSNLEGVDFVGAFDSMKTTDTLHGSIRMFSSLDDLFQSKINYAVIAVPTEYHLEIAMCVAEQGVNALVEKPLARDAASSEAISKVFATNNLIGAVGHIERFNPAIREAKKRLDILGDIFQVTTRRQGPFPGRISDVGVALDLATHDIDITSWITDQKFRSVFAATANRSNSKNEDMLLVTSKLRNGTISNHVVNWLSPKKERIVSIIGEYGLFEIDTLSADLTYFVNGTSGNEWSELARFRGVSEGDVIRFSFPKKEPLLIQHENFRDAILGKENNIVTMEEGHSVVRVAEAILKSSKSGNIEILEGL